MKGLAIGQEAVSHVSINICPEKFHGIEFRCVGRERLQVETREFYLKLADEWPLVNSAIIPQQDNFTSQVPQNQAQEISDIQGGKVILPKEHVQSQMTTQGRGCYSRNGRYTLVAVIVTDDRCLACRRPSPATRRNEQKPAFVNKNKVGVQPSPFFLCVAILPASSGLSFFHRVESPAARALGSSILPGEVSSRDGSDGTGRRTPAGLPGPFAARSTDRWRTRRPTRPARESSIGEQEDSCSACAVFPGLVWEQAPPSLPGHGHPSIPILKTPRLQPAVPPRAGSALCPVTRQPASAAAQVGAGIHEVSCPHDRQICSFTLAKLNMRSNARLVWPRRWTRGWPRPRPRRSRANWPGWSAG